MQAKKVLWVLPYLPWPVTSGGKSRQYQLMKSLVERGHQITLLVHSKTPLNQSVIDNLSFLEQIIVLPRRKLLSPTTLALILFSRYPLLTCVNGFNKALSLKFEELLSQHWDVIQIEHSYSFQPYSDQLRLKEIPYLLTEHNVESGLGAATYSRLPTILQPYSIIDRKKYQRWEKEVMQHAERVVAVTKEDAKELSIISKRSIDVVINGVDTQYFKDITASRDEQRVLFIGNYEYAPNVEAVEWLMTKIMPEVWLKHPAAKIMICGYAMPPAWKEQWPDDRIEYEGYVSDLRDAQNKSTVFIAALRSGGGSKLKVLEAMAAGLPLVSTSQGVSGLDVKLGVDYLGGDDVKSLVDALCLLLSDIERAKQVADSARQYVCSNNDWHVAAQQLEEVYNRMPS